MSNHNLSKTKQYSINPIAAAVSAALVAPAAAIAQEDGASDTIDEIIVTSRKRTENLQSVPSSIQALPESMLKEMGAQNTEDYARFIPSVSFISYTPGSNNIIFRGITTGLTDFIAQAGASIYLDEVSITSTGSQPDVRMMDIRSVEALAGPQGTLYGASAQAGILRIQSNQPDTSQFEGMAEISFRGGQESDNSHSITGVLNMPLVEDVFAIRVAAQTAEDGGFVDNVFGHTPDSHRDYTLPADSGTLDNADLVEENWNSVEYLAARITARWDINEDWSVSLGYNYQNNEANGENQYNPFVGDLQTIMFNPYERDDEWDLVSLTIEADLGFAQFVSATGFFDRTIDYSQDMTVYFKYYNSWGCQGRDPVTYYWLTFMDPGGSGQAIYYPQYCYSDTLEGDFLAVIEGPSWMDKFSQEFRLTHQGETFDWLAGIYYEEGSDNWDAVWMKPTNYDYQNSVALLAYEQEYGTTFPDSEGGWLSTDRTDWTQTAVFGEVTWHINDEWEVTVGGRYFERENDKLYTAATPDVNLLPEFIPPEPASQVASGKDKDFVPKLSVSWHLSDDKMVYGMYTEGFRPGGTNRGRGDASRNTFERVFSADNVANIEIGAKTRWADNTVQLNMSVFDMRWTDYQMEVVDPSTSGCDGTNEPYCDQPWQKVVANAGEAHTTGVQVELAWIPADGWDVGANAMWLEAETDDDFPEAAITAGLKLPNVPELKASAWASYSWPVEIGELVLRGQYSYTGDSENQMIPAAVGSTGNPTLTNESFSIADVRFAIVSFDGGWQLDLYINNITDERAQYFQNTGLFEYPFYHSTEYEAYHRVYTNRPREFGITWAKRWGD